MRGWHRPRWPPRRVSICRAWMRCGIRGTRSRRTPICATAAAIARGGTVASSSHSLPPICSPLRIGLTGSPRPTTPCMEGSSAGSSLSRAG